MSEKIYTIKERYTTNYKIRRNRVNNIYNKNLKSIR